MKRGLGRGLSALMGEKIELEEINLDGLSNIIIQNIVPNPKQPRVIFKENELEELVHSVNQNGVLQPIIVKPLENGKFEIVAGERRWRAATILNLKEIPAIVKTMNDLEALEVAIIENVQRENLSALEEAEAYSRLVNEYGYTQEKLASVVSKSRSHVANLLRMLSLPESVKKMMHDGLLSLGHAKLLVGKNDVENIAKAIIDSNFNVRESEAFIKNGNAAKLNKKSKKQQNNNLKTDDLVSIEEAVSIALEMPVEITQGSSGGQITIYFDDIEGLDKVIRRLTNSIS